MAKNPSPNQRVTDRMTSEMSTQTKRLVTKLQSEFQGPDRSNVSTPVWHAVIRDNWSDPMWRQEQATRMGEVPFVQDAMQAFGLDPKHLKTLQPADDSAMMQASAGLATPPNPLGAA